MIDSIACSFSMTGQGPALFLIHGIGASRQTWHKALPSLAAHFTVVTYDLRGHGESPLPDSDFVLDDLVEDLEKVRQHSGFEQAHFARPTHSSTHSMYFRLGYYRRLLFAPKMIAPRLGQWSALWKKMVLLRCYQH